ncbi:hypothetical protein G4407_02210 [Coprococcus comes]|nr:hypothetical protein [Coprococcus comes]
MRNWLSVLITDAKSKKESDIPIAPSLYSLSNEMDKSLLAVRDINHKYIVVDFQILGQGGLCLSCPVCTFPNCGFGKGGY